MELTVGASKNTGDVLALSDMVVYLQTSSDANNKAICTLPCKFVERVSVVGKTNGGSGSAVALGDKLYLDGTEVNKDTGGKPFGYALATVDSGATTTINVGFGL
jgi:hypothetical protein